MLATSRFMANTESKGLYAGPASAQGELSKRRRPPFEDTAEDTASEKAFVSGLVETAAAGGWAGGGERRSRSQPRCLVSRPGKPAFSQLSQL